MFLEQVKLARGSSQTRARFRIHAGMVGAIGSGTGFLALSESPPHVRDDRVLSRPSHLCGLAAHASDGVVALRCLLAVPPEPADSEDAAKKMTSVPGATAAQRLRCYHQIFWRTRMQTACQTARLFFTLLILVGSAFAADGSSLKPPTGARVAVIVFEDLECPYCAHAYPLVWQAAKSLHPPAGAARYAGAADHPRARHRPVHPAAVSRLRRQGAGGFPHHP